MIMLIRMSTHPVYPSIPSIYAQYVNLHASQVTSRFANSSSSSSAASLLLLSGAQYLTFTNPRGYTSIFV